MSSGSTSGRGTTGQAAPDRFEGNPKRRIDDGQLLLGSFYWALRWCRWSMPSLLCCTGFPRKRNASWPVSAVLHFASLRDSDGPAVDDGLTDVGGVDFDQALLRLLSGRFGRLNTVRHTEFRALMGAHFGPLRAPSVAQDHVFAALGGRTADQALDAGVSPKKIWARVCIEFDVPAAMHHGLPD